MGVAQIVAEKIAVIRYQDLPPEAIYRCKVAVMDKITISARSYAGA